MELTKERVLAMFECLGKLNIKPTIKWGYAASRNRELLTPFVKAIQESQRFGKDREDFAEYEQKRQELIKQFSSVNEGPPNVVDDGRGALTRTVHPSNYGPYMVAMDALKDQYPNLIRDIEKHFQDFEKSLQDTETINIRIVKVKDVPDGLTQVDYNILLPMIEDPDAVEG